MDYIVVGFVALLIFIFDCVFWI